jgi:hypothetical protein
MIDDEPGFLHNFASFPMHEWAMVGLFILETEVSISGLSHLTNHSNMD